MLVKFSLKLAYATMCGKKSQIYGVHIPRKCIESKCFYSYPPLSTQNSPPNAYHHTLGREKFLIPNAIFFRKSVSLNIRKRYNELETMN